MISFTLVARLVNKCILKCECSGLVRSALLNVVRCVCASEHEAIDESKS